MPLDVAAFPALGQAKCDGKGNVYARLVAGGYQPHIFSTPITEFSADGDRRAVFSLDSVAGWNPGDIMDFAVGPNGGVYLLADHPGKHGKIENGILAFNGDGDPRFTLRLSLGVSYLSRLAVFSSGDFLALGIKEAKVPPPLIPGAPVPSSRATKRRPPVNPVAFLVSRSGRLIKTIALPESLDLAGGRSGPPLRVSATAGDTAQLSMDGYGETAYLMVQGTEPLVYAISSAGKILRDFPIEPPPGGFTAIKMAWADGLGLLLETAHIVNHGILNSQVRFSVVDPQTGERLDDYRLGQGLGTALACFSRQHITFLTSAKGKLAMTDATIR